MATDRHETCAFLLRSGVSPYEAMTQAGWPEEFARGFAPHVREWLAKYGHEVTPKTDEGRGAIGAPTVEKDDAPVDGEQAHDEAPEGEPESVADDTTETPTPTRKRRTPKEK